MAHKSGSNNSASRRAQRRTDAEFRAENPDLEARAARAKLHAGRGKKGKT